MICYDFFAPPQIIFGWGRRTELGRLVRPLGQKVLLVWGSRTVARSAVGQEILNSLAEQNIETAELATINREPLVDDVDQTLVRLKQLGAHNAPVVLAVGGGSAIDLAKAVAALATNDSGNSVSDYLEGVGRGLKLVQAPLPVVAVPTTAGTGSEATKNAVISSHDPAFKKSLRHEQMVPRLALVDPELTISLPPAITAQTGMDAITQLIESYISRRAQPLPQALAAATLRSAITALPVAMRDGTDRVARETMSQAALVSGIALANSGLGMAHGVAAALGVHCGLAHGLACAIMLPATLRANQAVAVTRLAELGRTVGVIATSTAAAADAFIDRIEHLCREVGVPERLSEVGVRQEQIADLVRDARGNSMSGNPRDLSDAQLQQILEQIW